MVGNISYAVILYKSASVLYIEVNNSVSCAVNKKNELMSLFFSSGMMEQTLILFFFFTCQLTINSFGGNRKTGCALVVA